MEQEQLSYDQEILYSYFKKVSPDGSLFNQFWLRTLDYYDALLKLGEAQTTACSPFEQLRVNVDGRYNDLSSVVEQANNAFKTHHPPLPALPTLRPELSEFVRNFMGDIFQSRRR